LADANLINYIASGFPRREPLVDFQTADQASLAGKTDLEVLRIAAASGRILATHDRRTMPAAFADFVSNEQCAGVVILPLKLEWAQAIDDLLLIWTASQAEEWVNVLTRLPP
jgi:hypothetical protein